MSGCNWHLISAIMMWLPICVCLPHVTPHMHVSPHVTPPCDSPYACEFPCDSPYACDFSHSVTLPMVSGNLLQSQDHTQEVRVWWHLADFWGEFLSANHIAENTVVMQHWYLKSLATSARWHSTFLEHKLAVSSQLCVQQARNQPNVTRPSSHLSAVQ